eukprot:1606379-Rhodomonas_salina.1
MENNTVLPLVVLVLVVVLTARGQQWKSAHSDTITTSNTITTTTLGILAALAVSPHRLHRCLSCLIATSTSSSACHSGLPVGSQPPNAMPCPRHPGMHGYPGYPGTRVPGYLGDR